MVEGPWWADFIRKQSSELAAAIFIRQRALSNRHRANLNWLYFTAGGLLWSHTDRTIDKSDHQNVPASIHRLSQFYPYAKLKPKKINFDCDTWLKKPMSRLHTDTVQRTGSRHFHKTTRAYMAAVDVRPWEQRTIDRGCVSAGIWEATRYRWTDGRRGQRGRPAEGAADGDKCFNCQASVGVDRWPTGRQTTLHMPGSRRRASGQAAALGGDKRAMTAWSDGRVLSLFRRQSRERSIKQWDSNRAVGWPKSDGGSLVRSENTTGANRPSIELSHGR